ncbi:MAG: hypothetical protein WBD31_32710 [Rubripirellula sp.]
MKLYFGKRKRIMFAESYGLITCQMISESDGKNHTTVVKVLKRDGKKYRQIGEIPLENCTDMQHAMHRCFKQASIALQRV